MEVHLCGCLDIGQEEGSMQEQHQCGTLSQLIRDRPLPHDTPDLLHEMVGKVKTISWRGTWHLTFRPRCVMTEVWYDRSQTDFERLLNVGQQVIRIFYASGIAHQAITNPQPLAFLRRQLVVRHQRRLFH